MGGCQECVKGIYLPKAKGQPPFIAQIFTSCIYEGKKNPTKKQP